MTAVPLDNTAIEEHLATLLDKLEAMREAREAAFNLGRRYRPPVRTEIRTLEFWRSIIAECFAAFFYVFLVSAAAVKTEMMPGDAVLTTGLASGLGMMVLVYCFGRISGGHVNPAITLAHTVTKKITPLRGIMFVLAQCGGAIGGAALLYGVAVPGGSATPSPMAATAPLGPWERFGVELVLTFIVAFTQISASATDRQVFNNSPHLVGAAYTACSLVPGAILNPTRALGPAFVTNKHWESHWVFWLGPAIGACLAAVIFQFIFNAKGLKRPKDSIDGDSSSIQSEDEHFEDGKYHATSYRPVAPNPASQPGTGMYCGSEVSTARYSSPPSKAERGEPIYVGKSSKSVRGELQEDIYSGTRSLYNAKIDTRSPPLTRANLNRSQSVYSKTQNPRDLLPRPGPLVPAQSLYPLKLGGQFTANIRDFTTVDGNFITGIKTEDGNYLKVNGLSAGTATFLANRGGSKSYHDIAESDKPTSAHVANQNLQNQLLGGDKENIYGLRGSPAGAGTMYPNAESRQPVMSRTAAYVKSVQSHAQKQRESNYDVVPSGPREVPGYGKAHNRSETSDYGSNRSDRSYTTQQRGAPGSEKLDGKSERLEPPPLPVGAGNPPPPPQMRLITNKMADQMGYLAAPRHSPISSVSSSYSHGSPNPPYPPPPC